MRPMAIASENSSASRNGRCSSEVDHEDRDRAARPRPARAGTRTAAARPGTRSRPAARRARPRSGRTRSACRCARRRPRPEPSRTIVPISAHDLLVAPSARPVLSTGIDSPVSTASSHSSSTVSSRRTSAGTMSPTESCTTSPGTSVDRRRSRRGTPSRITSAVCRICECSAATACSDRYSLTNPSPTDNVDDHADDHRVGRVAGEARDRRRREEQEQQRIAQLPGEHRPRTDRVTAQRVRPVLGEAPLRLVLDKPGRPRLECGEGLGGRQSARRGRDPGALAGTLPAS